MAQPSKEFMEQATYLVDASSFIFRAYYGLNNSLKAPDGTPTHATYGFLNMILPLISDVHAKSSVLIWDRPEPGFRHEIFEDYKANRGVPPEDLGLQIDNAKKGSQLLGIQQFDAKGYEADDIIASMIRKFPEHKFVVVTGDKDLLQLVGDQVWCWDTMKDKWSNVDEAKEKFGVHPDLIPDVQALCGDSVDNIPGVPGVGIKTATQLISHFGDLDTVLKEATKRWASDELKKIKTDPLKGKKIENIATNIDKAKLSLKLVSLSHKAPVPKNIEDLHVEKPNWQSLQDYCEHLGFNRLLSRLKKYSNNAGAKTDIATKKNTGAKSTSSDSMFKCICIKSLKEFEDVLAENVNCQLLALDTETSSLNSFDDSNLVGISLAFDNKKGYYIPLRHDEGNIKEGEKGLKHILRALNLYLKYKGSEFSLVMQNAKFDWHIMRSASFEWPENLIIHDSMVASFILDPSGKHGLDYLVKKYFKDYQMQSFKEILGEAKTFAGVPVDKALFYAVEDAVMTRQLWQKLEAELKEKDLWAVYDKIDRPLITLLCKMERQGVLVCPEYLETLSKEFHKELDAIIKKARKSLVDSGIDDVESYNLNSTKQIAELLFDKLQLPIIKKTKTGASTDVNVLNELKSSHDFPKLLLEYRELSKLLSTYVDSLPKLIHPQTNRIHTQLSQTVAATGRLASSNPNLQNIPIKTERGASIRKAFIAPPGYVLIGADYSQMELRIFAHMTQDKGLLKAFNDGLDIHSHTAALILGKKDADVTPDDRRMAKTINFGIVYGQTPFGLAKSLGISRGDAKQFIDDYFASYPGIKTYMEEIVKSAHKNGEVQTLCGRKRFIPEINSKNHVLKQNAERIAINSPIQGTAADLMKLAMIEVSKVIEEKFPNTKLILQVHDELIVECPKEKASEVCETIQSVMEDPALFKVMGISKLRVTMKTDLEVGENWGEI